MRRTKVTQIYKKTDEQSAPLPPTHTIKSGKRIRYYISRCLVTGKAEDHPNAWRLPAVALEDQLEALVQDHLTDPSPLAALRPAGTASDLLATAARVKEVVATLKAEQSGRSLELIKRVALGSGQVTLSLNPSHIAVALACTVDQIDASSLTWSAPLTLKRRGVETRLILGSALASVDPTLIRNTQRARDWYQKIPAGQSFADILRDTGTDKNRLKHLIQLAFLAPDLLASISSGTQPIGFTSEWLKTNTLPTDWTAQRQLFDRL